MNRLPPEALTRHPPRGTTLVAGAGPATAFWHRLLRADRAGLLRGPMGWERAVIYYEFDS